MILYSSLPTNFCQISRQLLEIAQSWKTLTGLAFSRYGNQAYGLNQWAICSGNLYISEILQTTYAGMIYLNYKIPWWQVATKTFTTPNHYEKKGVTHAFLYFATSLKINSIDIHKTYQPMVLFMRQYRHLGVLCQFSIGLGQWISSKHLWGVFNTFI